MRSHRLRKRYGRAVAGLTQARAREIVEQARAKAVHGPWVDQLDRVMTAEEKAAVVHVWDTMPGHTSFYDALMRIVHGKVRR